MLGDYDAVMDLPGCVLAKELIEAYPDAKVLLTIRDYESWEHSMKDSIWCLDMWTLFRLCRTLGLTQLAPVMRLVHVVFRVHNGNNYGGPIAKEAYEKHYDTVRSLVPAGRILEIDTESDLTWGPLCDFLGDSIPKEQYPKLREEKAMRQNLEKAWWSMVRYTILMILLPGMVTVTSVMMYLYAGEITMFRDNKILGPLKGYLDS